MKKIYIIISLLIIQQSTLSQEIILGDSLSIELKKTKTVSKTFNVRSSTKVKSDDLEKILTRCKIIALNENPVDINAFSLLDTENKIRYRISEFIGYKAISVMGSGLSSEMFLTKPILNKKGKPYPQLPKYDKSVKDSFKSYSFDGYENVEVPINFGTKKKKALSPVYYKPVTMKQFTAEIYFVVLGNLKTPMLELYYGKKRMFEIELED